MSRLSIRTAYLELELGHISQISAICFHDVLRFLRDEHIIQTSQSINQYLMKTTERFKPVSYTHLTLPTSYSV